MPERDTLSSSERRTVTGASTSRPRLLVRHPVEATAVVVLIAGIGLGLALWGKWGFLVAFEAFMKYCF